MAMRNHLAARTLVSEWMTTLTGLLVLSFIGVALLLSAESAQKQPESIILRKPISGKASAAVYIYDAPSAPLQSSGQMVAE